MPLNNGDVALFLTLYKNLISKGFSVKIATYYYKQAIKLYPELPFVKELGDYKLFIKLPFLKPLLIPFLFIISKPFRKATIIIGAPGGYINSNYAIKNSLSTFKIAKFLGKKTFIYSQSVGPLNKKDGTYFKNLMNKYIDYIYVRDEYSMETMRKTGVSKSKYKLTNDAAFLIKPVTNNNQKSNKIAFSVRTWNYDNRSLKNYENMISKLIILAVDKGYKIDFLSTCQGLKNYKNDAVIAESIYQKLPKNYQDKVTVLTSYYSFDKFYGKLDEYDFVVGTRLHMCITALTKMIPAFNISYEVKGKECYNYLGLENNTIDYNEDIDNAIRLFRNFVDNKETIQKHIASIIPKINQKANADFDYFITKITEN